MNRQILLTRSGRRRRMAGVTLLELMVSVILIVILSVAVTRAFVAALDAERAFNRRAGVVSPQQTVEPQLRQLIEATILSESTTDATTYFIGEYGNEGSYAQQQYGVSTTGSTLLTSAAGNGSTTNLGTSGGTTGGSGSNTAGNGTDLGCDRLTFTTTYPDTPIGPESDTDDWQTQEQKYGPIGGVAEVSLSTTAVGDAGDRVGLFERLQRPADGDSTQGGQEWLLSDQIKSIGFQFWDGTEWEDTWDTTEAPYTGRLPTAVQVSYTLRADPAGNVYQFVVPMPGSNVTIANPITQTGTTGATP